MLLMFTNLNTMLFDCMIMMFNHETGEVYARSRKNDFNTQIFQNKELLYRWCDSLLRAVDAGERLPTLQIQFQRKPKEKDIF